MERTCIQSDFNEVQVSGGGYLSDSGRQEHSSKKEDRDQIQIPEPGSIMTLENKIQMMDSYSSRCIQLEQEPKCKGDVELLESALVAWKNQNHDNDLREIEVLELRKTIKIIKRDAEEKTVDLKRSLEMQQATIDALHSELNWLDNLNKDIAKLKKKNTELESQIQAGLESSAGKEKDHAEMVNSLKTLHKEELEQTKTNLNKHLEIVKKEFEEKIRVKDEEIAQIKEKLLQVEKEKQTEVSIMKMDFENKMRKLQQKKISIASNQQTPAFSQDIYRKKLQHLKTEYEQENTALKNQIKFLQQQLNTKCIGRKSFTK